MTFNCQRMGPKQDPPGRLSSDFTEYANLKELLVVGRETRSILQDSVKCAVCAAHKVCAARKVCAAHKVCAAYKKQSETRNICKVCVVLLHKGSCFEKYHSVMNN